MYHYGSITGFSICSTFHEAMSTISKSEVKGHVYGEYVNVGHGGDDCMEVVVMIVWRWEWCHAYGECVNVGHGGDDCMEVVIMCMVRWGCVVREWWGCVLSYTSVFATCGLLHHHCMGGKKVVT